ncbi:hypothetical protein PR202_gb29629 [Eleusine coracana subsp. coracana]|uniref:WAT1-related protein n=1 Tax=Eleusine coracana subsp. coracana TaxID=191504 RepID=A0AAV5FZD2_ELECO|nr:hypothetical protein PR202_gb29629 [Eleusine coracana subsp. coracana]
MAGAPATGAATVPSSRGCWEDGANSLGLVAVQLGGAAYTVVVTPVLALGLDPLFLVAVGSLCTGILTLPFALNIERLHTGMKKWPSGMSNRLLLEFIVLALGGVTGFQALMLHGMKMTSPAIASAMPNLAPGIIFIVSGCLGFERVDLRCRYTRAKILGTVVCLGGAVAMSVLQSPATPRGHRPIDHAAAVARSHRDWVAGCLFLLGAVLVLSATIVLQVDIHTPMMMTSATMIHFPAPFTLCSVTSLIGAVLTAAFQVVTAGQFSPGTPQISLEIVLSLVLVGGLVSSACIMFQTWALERKGPVMVSIFSPTQTVGSAIFSALFLGRVMQPGSGAILKLS